MNSQANRTAWSVWLLAVLVPLAALAGAGSLLWHRVQADPGFPMLISRQGARWIRFDRPYRFYAQKIEEQATLFRTTFNVEQAAPDAVLTVYAYRGARVYLDDRPLNYFGPPLESWKDPVRFPIGRFTQPGEHELRIVVINSVGPPALLAWCDEFGIKSGPDWQAADGSETGFRPAISLDEPRITKLVRSFPGTLTALSSQLPLLLAVFGGVFTITLLRGWNVLPATPLARRPEAAPSLVRFLILGLWLALGINNCSKLDLIVGFDAAAHQKYMQFLIEREQLPYADDGWQMFQTPLYYLVSVTMVAALLPIVEINTIWPMLRIIPFVCGALQVEWCYRALRHAFPDRGDLQTLGVLVGGLMPMNIYISMGYTNEPMAGMFSALAVLWAVKAFRQPALAQTFVWPWYLGVLLGLAILSKFTAVLLIPPLALCLIWQMRPLGATRIASGLFSFAAAGCLVCGWYFVRNVLKFGKPFVGGWDPIRKIAWWQDPGYRSLDQILVFGESLAQPIYGATYGFLDGIYCTMWLDGYLSGTGFSDRPPWNFAFLISLAALSLLPMLAILVGMATSFRHPDRSTRQILLFSTACVGIYMAAIFYLFLTLPIVSTTKASYMIGLLPCLAILFTGGVERFLRPPVVRAAVYGWMACWALFAFVSFYIIT